MRVILVFLLISSFSGGNLAKVVVNDQKDWNIDDSSWSTANPVKGGACKLMIFAPEFSSYTTQDEIIKFFNFSLKVANKINDIFPNAAYTIVSYSSRPLQDVNNYYGYQEFAINSQAILENYLNSSTRLSNVYLAGTLNMFNSFFNDSYPPVLPSIQLVVLGEDDKIKDPTTANKAAMITAKYGVNTFVIDQSAHDFPGSAFNILTNNSETRHLKGEMTSEKLAKLENEIVSAAMQENCPFTK